MERDPLLSPTPDTLLALKKSEDAVQARRGFMVTAFAGILSLYGVHRIREADLDTRSVKTTLETFSEGMSVGGEKVHVRIMNEKGSTHAVVIAEMPPLTTRTCPPNVEETVVSHLTPELVRIILGLAKEHDVSTFFIDDRSFFIENGHIAQANSHSSTVAYYEDNKKHDPPDPTIDGKIQLSENGATLNKKHAVTLMGEELTSQLLKERIAIKQLEPSEVYSMKRFGIPGKTLAAPDPYKYPDHTPEQLDTFLGERAASWCNAVILTAQPKAIEEALRRFNGKNGPTFSAAILTPVHTYEPETEEDLALNSNQ